MKLTLEQQKANRKLWVEALRSGKYKQTKEALKRKSGGMCCLGVLCDLAGVAWRDDPYCKGKMLPVGRDTHLAPDDAMEFVGLRTSAGGFCPHGDVWEELSRLNDSGKRFKAIAKIIESEPLSLFVESVSP